jgi:hypothetical protein
MIREVEGNVLGRAATIQETRTSWIMVRKEYKVPQVFPQLLNVALVSRVKALKYL